MKLVHAPYGGKGFTTDNPVVKGGYGTIKLTPYKGGYIVSLVGEHMGFIKKNKAGWTLDGERKGGRWAETLRLAAKLMDDMKGGQCSACGRPAHEGDCF